MLANFGLPSSLGTPHLPTRLNFGLPSSLGMPRLNFGLAKFTKLKKKIYRVNGKKVLHSVIEKNKNRQKVNQNSPSK
jgi:hypothetical protein